MSDSLDKKIIDYCYSQIDRQKLTDDLRHKYASYLENENAVAMYYTLEEFITTNTYPIIKHETDKPHLREKIMKEFDINACSRDLRIIFLPFLFLLKLCCFLHSPNHSYFLLVDSQ